MCQTLYSMELVLIGVVEDLINLCRTRLVNIPDLNVDYVSFHCRDPNFLEFYLLQEFFVFSSSPELTLLSKALLFALPWHKKDTYKRSL